MTRKQKILEELNAGGILLETRVNEGLAANDRAKYYLALIGLAFEQGVAPKADPEDLKRERETAGIEDAWLDETIPASRREDRRVVFPRSQEILDRAMGEARGMLASIEACGAPDAPALARRLAAIERDLAGAAREGVQAWVVERVSSADREREDGLHLFVMDAHKALNRIAHTLAREKIDGASVYALGEGDADRVAAFMAGVNRTQGLRFDHPGLDTTATRIGGRLVIQNDVGQTDAHVFILSVEGRQVDLTYTDVHDKRMAFFQWMLAPLQPEWRTVSMRHTEGLPESSEYFIVHGTIRSTSDEGVEKILETIGSRLVFLIDWNKARKRLRIFCKGSDAVEILKWSTEEEIGHMGFLKLGGEELVYEALQFVEPGSIRLGEPLYSLLGRMATKEFLKQMLAMASQGLRGGESELLIRNRVKAAFLRFYRTRPHGPIEACRDLAGLVVESALTIRDMLRAVARRDAAFLERNATRLHDWEEASDQRLNRLRKEVRGRGKASLLSAAAVRIDDAQDDLEEAGHLVTLFDPDRTPAELRFQLESLADLTVRAAQEGYKAVASAEDVHVALTSLEDFSRSIDRLDAIDHGARELRREVRGGLVGAQGAPAGLILLANDLSGKLADASASLARAGFALHEAMFESPPGSEEKLE
ncbi:MAG: hypothetical protein JXP34_25375 [Planctomycetes bacterium]|nr:hypothetical protein [Planctomycetota bacterium]